MATVEPRHSQRRGFDLDEPPQTDRQRFISYALRLGKRAASTPTCHRSPMMGSSLSSPCRVKMLFLAMEAGVWPCFWPEHGLWPRHQALNKEPGGEDVGGRAIRRTAVTLDTYIRMHVSILGRGSELPTKSPRFLRIFEILCCGFR